MKTPRLVDPQVGLCAEQSAQILFWALCNSAFILSLAPTAGGTSSKLILVSSMSLRDWRIQASSCLIFTLCVFESLSR